MRTGPPLGINTEHFQIQTNVTLAEAISFGRRLEAFHDVFMVLMADILGENIPLVRRFKNPSMNGEPGYKPHSVYYFGSKSEYADYLTPRHGPEIAHRAWDFTTRPRRVPTNACRPIFFVTPKVSCP